MHAAAFRWDCRRAARLVVLGRLLHQSVEGGVFPTDESQQAAVGADDLCDVEQDHDGSNDAGPIENYLVLGVAHGNDGWKLRSRAQR